MKNNLENVEKFNTQYDSLDNNIVKRDVMEEYEYDLLNEESRGWKNKDKKKKKKFKNKNKQKYKLLKESFEDENIDKSSDDDEEAIVTTTTSTTEGTTTESKNQVYQFSAYSSNPQPAVQHQSLSYPQPVYNPEQTGQKKKYVYSIDYHGNEHYIDEDELSALLRTPQAKKVRH